MIANVIHLKDVLDIPDNVELDLYKSHRERAKMSKSEINHRTRCEQTEQTRGL